MHIQELAKMYEKVKSGRASPEEVINFEVKLEMHSFERDYLIYKLEEYLRKHKPNNMDEEA